MMMSTEQTMDTSDDSWSACSTISSDSTTNQAAAAAAVGWEGEWSDDNQAKLDAVTDARTDVDIAEAACEAAEQVLLEATEQLKHAMQGLTNNLKARFMPPRVVNIAKANQLRAKKNANLARLRFKYCESVLERKREEASKLGIDVRPVPQLIRLPSTITARGA